MAIGGSVDGGPETRKVFTNCFHVLCRVAYDDEE